MDIAALTRGVSASSVEAELKTYVEDKGLDALFVGIVERILMAKPDNPVQFVVDYLRERYPDRVSAPTAGYDGVQERQYERVGTDEAPDVESSDDEGDYVDELPPLAGAVARAVELRRNSVSSEAGMTTEQASTELEAVAARAVAKEPEDARRVRAMLSRNLLFAHLDDQQAGVVVNALQPQSFDAGAVIMRQGEAGDTFFLIDSGSCDVYVAETGRMPGVVASAAAAAAAASRTRPEGGGASGQYGTRVLGCHAGDSFGARAAAALPCVRAPHAACCALALSCALPPPCCAGELALMYSAPRASTVVAVTNVHTWVLTRAAYRAIVLGTLHRRRSRLRSYLEQVPLLGTLTEEERLAVADALQPRVCRPGEIIVKQGEPGHHFFIVEEVRASP